MNASLAVAHSLTAKNHLMDQIPKYVENGQTLSKNIQDLDDRDM